MSVLLGFVVLLPSLWYLYRLVLQGRLSQEYEPLDQRFRPLDAGDDPGRIAGADPRSRDPRRGRRSAGC